MENEEGGSAEQQLTTPGEPKYSPAVPSLKGQAPYRMEEEPVIVEAVDRVVNTLRTEITRMMHAFQEQLQRLNELYSRVEEIQDTISAKVKSLENHKLRSHDTLPEKTRHAQSWDVLPDDTSRSPDMNIRW